MAKEIEVGYGALDELPARNIRKGEVLMALPEIQEATAKIIAGIPTGTQVHVRLDPEYMRRLKITTAGRIVQEQWMSMIADKHLKSKGGKALRVGKYKAADGVEIVYVTDAVDLYVRTSSKRRTKRRHEGHP